MYASLYMYLKTKYLVHELLIFFLQSKEDIQLRMNNFFKRTLNRFLHFVSLRLHLLNQLHYSFLWLFIFLIFPYLELLSKLTFLFIHLPYSLSTFQRTNFLYYILPSLSIHFSCIYLWFHQFLTSCQLCLDLHPNLQIASFFFLQIMLLILFETIHSYFLILLLLLI